MTIFTNKIGKASVQGATDLTSIHYGILGVMGNCKLSLTNERGNIY